MAVAQGDLLGDRYRLLEQIGRGGMGVVWRGHDETLGRDVAIKVMLLPEGLGEQDADLMRRRAFREARSIAQLNHVSLVTIHDVTEHEGNPVLVMELINGRTLDHVIREEGRLTVRRTAELGRALLPPLRTAHAAGIVHRDLKPGNIHLDGEGRVVITDFGIASLAGDSTLTQAGVLLGSPAYLSPEQATGGTTTAASDLWGLGATLYHSVEGRPPYEGDLIAVIGAVITRDPEAPRHAGLLTSVLQLLLQKEPERRPGIEELDELLTDALRTLDEEDVPTAAHPSTPQIVPADPADSVETVVPVELTMVDTVPPQKAVTLPGNRNKALAGVVAAVAVVMTAAIVLPLTVLRSNDDGGSNDPVTAATSASPTPTASSATPSPSPTPSPTRRAKRPPIGPAGTPSGTVIVPDGYRKYVDKGLHFSAVVPSNYHKMWYKSTKFLEIDEGDTNGDINYGFHIYRLADYSDALEEAKGTESWEKGNKDVSHYKRLRLEAVDYFDEAAEVEFTYRNGNGPWRTMERTFLIDGATYAVSCSSRPVNWTRLKKHCAVFFDTFRRV